MRFAKITREFLKTIRSVDKRVTAFCVAAVLLFSMFGFMTRYYTLAYDVYYDGEYVGTVSGKREALAAGEAVGEEDNLRLVLRVAPAAAIGVSDISIAILVRATDAEECASVEVDGETLVSVKDAATAQEVVTKYAESFGSRYYEILTDYNIKTDARLPEEIYSAEEAEKIIAESGKITVRYEKTTCEFESVEREVEYIDDDTLALGTEVVEQEGADGIISTLTTATYVNNEMVNLIEKTREQTSDPVTKIVRVGAAPSGLPESFDCPTDGVLTSPFGERWEKNHNGVDIGAPEGTPIYAVAAGTVEIAGYDDSGYGNRVKIDHGLGWETLYAHMTDIYVSDGDTVTAGQLIGTVGSTGRSTGPHLHFEVIKDGVYRNPSDFTEIKTQ